MANLTGKKLSIQNHFAAGSAGVRAAGAAMRSFKTVKEIQEKQEKGGCCETRTHAARSTPTHTHPHPRRPTRRCARARVARLAGPAPAGGTWTDRARGFSPPRWSGETGPDADPMAGMTAKQLKATQDSLPVFLEAM